MRKHLNPMLRSTSMRDILRTPIGGSAEWRPEKSPHFNPNQGLGALDELHRYADGGAVSDNLRDRDFEIARAVAMATRNRRPPDDSGSGAPMNALPFDGGDLDPGSNDPGGGQRFLGMLKATGASAVDPFGATSWALERGGASTAANALREAYEGEPVAAGVGSFLTPFGLLARPADVVARAFRAARIPAAGAAGGAALFGDADAAAQSSRRSRPVTPATQDDLMSDVERRATPNYNPMTDAKTELAGIEDRIAKDVAELARIGSTSLPGNAVTANASRERMSGPIAARITQDQARAAHLRTVIDELGEIDKPLRERYPIAGTAAVLGPTAAAYLLARGTFGKLAKNLDNTVEAARDAERAGRSVDVIRQGQIAGDQVRRLGPAQIATGVGAALLPIEGQGLVDAIDYKSAPRWTRAYREAEETFKDPAAWLQKQAIPAAAGAAAAFAGYKSAPLAPVAAARNYARTSEAFDPRNPVVRSLVGRSAPETIAPRYALDAARASRGDAMAARSEMTASEARKLAAEARGATALARGQADYDETVARALSAADAPPVTGAPMQIRSRYQTPEPDPALLAGPGSPPVSSGVVQGGAATPVSPPAVPANLPGTGGSGSQVQASLPTPARPANPLVPTARQPSLSMAQKDSIKNEFYREADRRGTMVGIRATDLSLPKGIKVSDDVVDRYLDSVRGFASQRAQRTGDLKSAIEDLRQLRADGVKFAVPLGVGVGVGADMLREPSDREAAIERAMRVANRSNTADRSSKMNGGSVERDWHHSWDQSRNRIGRWA